MLQIMKFQVLPPTLKNMVSDSDIAWEEDDSAIEAGEDDAEAGFPGTSTSTDTPDAPQYGNRVFASITYNVHIDIYITIYTGSPFEVTNDQI